MTGAVADSLRGAGDDFAYVGCYTTPERKARGRGINVYRCDAASNNWEHVQLAPTLPNPCFLAVDRTKHFLYSVHADRDEISSFAIEATTGRLTRLNQQSTKGENPVHLAASPSNDFMLVANYRSSSIAVLPLRQDGSLGEVVDLVLLDGPIGPHRVQQPASRPHQVEFDPSGRFVLVPDKGLDCIFTFRLSSTGKLIATDPAAVSTREMSGPRHIAFHRTLPVAYVVGELDSTVTSYRWDAETGQLAPFQIIPSLPQNYTGNSRAAEIAVSPDGRYVCASNRGADSIAVFSVEANTGWLTVAGFPSSAGSTPRCFALDPTGRSVLVSNEGTDSIARFTLDQATGTLTKTGAVNTPSPACIVFRHQSYRPGHDALPVAAMTPTA